MLPAMIFASTLVQPHGYDANLTNNWANKTNDEIFDNLSDKPLEHGTKKNHLTQQDLIDELSGVNVEYTTVNKYDTLGIYPHILSFEKLPTWIKKRNTQTK